MEIFKRLCSNLTRLFTIVILLLFVSQNAKSQALEGKEFWYTMPENYTGLVPTTQFYMTGYYDAIITITFPAKTGVAPTILNLTGGGNVSYELSAAYIDAIENFEKVGTNGVKITSTQPIAIFSVNFADASVEVSNVFPIDKLGTEYLTLAYRENDSATPFNSRVNIVATEDNTLVNIELPLSCWTSTLSTLKRKGGSKWSVLLNKGQTYQFICNNHGQGRNVKAPAPTPGNMVNNFGLNAVSVKSNKKIAIIGGTDCTRIGDVQYPGCSACDVSFSQMQPLNMVGSRYITTQTLSRGNNTLPLGNNTNSSIADYLFFCATADATTINITGSGIMTKTLNKGETFLYEPPGRGLDPTKPGRADNVIQANKPVMLIQLEKGFYCDNQNAGGADPSQMTVFDETTWRKSYILVNPSNGTAQFPNNYLVLIVKDTGNPGNTARSSVSVLLNNATVPIPQGNSQSGDGTGGWTRIGTEPYYVQRLLLAGVGTIRVKSDSLMSYYASGAAGPGSYGYMGGATCNMTVESHADTACIGNATTFKIDTVLNGQRFKNVINQSTYKWYPNILTPAVTVNGVNAKYTYPTSGTFTAVLDFTDVAGCQDLDTFQVLVTPPIDTPKVNGPTSVCVGGTVVLKAVSKVPGVKYRWYSAATGGTVLSDKDTLSVNVLPPTTTRYVEVYTSTCISARKAHTITIASGLSNPFVDGDTVICTGNAATLIAQSGLTGETYTWYRDASGLSTRFVGKTFTTPILIADTTYYLRVNQGAGCQSGLTTVKVRVSASGVATLTATNASVCTGEVDTIKLLTNPSAGSTITWGFAGGMVTNGNGTGPGPHAIKWSTAGIKKVTVNINKDNCIKTDTLVINVKPIPKADFIATPAELCVTSSSNIEYGGNAPVGATYTWNFDGGMPVSTGIGQGPHEIRWTTPGSKVITLTVVNNGCTSEEYIQLVMVSKLSLVFDSVATSGCNPFGDGVVSVTVIDGVAPYSYTWAQDPNNNSDRLEGLQPGKYDVTVQDNSGCSATGSVTVNAGTTVVSFTNNIINASCGANADGSNEVTTTGGKEPYGYAFYSIPGGVLQSSDSNTISGLAPGMYETIFTDANTCERRDTFTINGGGAVIDSISGNKVICEGNSTTLTLNPANQPNTTITWFDKNTGAQLFTGNPYTSNILTTSQVYRVSANLTGSSCPPTEQIINVTVANNNLAQAVINCMSSTNNSITIGWSNVTSADMYEVSEDGGASFIMPNGTGNSHTVSGLTENEIRSFVIRSSRAATSTCPQATSTSVATTCGSSTAEGSLLFPDIFLPESTQGGETNFIPKSKNLKPDTYRLSVYSRWGELLFESKKEEDYWKGRRDNLGDVLPQGVYLYIATAETLTNMKLSVAGTVTIRK